MRQTLDIWKWVTPLIVLLATACGHEELVPPDVYVEESEPYVEVRIAVPLANPASTRANPMGGEEGNGRERGVLNEDKIHDINVYFYKNNEGEDGMNGSDNTRLLFHLFYNILNPNDYLNTKVDSIKEVNTYYGERYYTLKFKYWDQNGDISDTKGMKFLAIANAGDLGDIDQISTLGELRNINFGSNAYGTNAWCTKFDLYSKDASNMDFFIMSTAYNQEYRYGGQSTGDNTISEGKNGDYIGTTTLQRMYARLDLSYSKSDNAVTTGSGDSEKVKELKYAVQEATGNTVFLTHVLPVNVMQKPSFLFKKVTKDVASFSSTDLSGLTSDKYLWGGKENPTDGPYSSESTYNDRPTNYVIERHTLSKKDDGKPGGETSYRDSLSTWYGNTAVEYVSGKSKFNNLDCSITTSGLGGLLDYYHGSPASGNNIDERIAIIGYANENTQPTDCYRSEYLTGMAFRAVYVPDVKKIYSAYDKNTKVLTELDQTVESINGGEIYRYSPTTIAQTDGYSLYFTSKAAANDYAIDNPGDMAIISEPYSAYKHGDHWGFICYYNLWLRHYNDVDDAKTDPHPHLPMEYATVRNNIYRVSVSFRGPGDPTPTMREPDTMKARIFVRKWNYREEDKIIYD